jgi:hypothetical protein
MMGIQHQNRKLEQVNFQSKMPITLVSFKNPFQESSHLGQQNIYPIMITFRADRFYINYLRQTLFDLFQKI